MVIIISAQYLTSVDGSPIRIVYDDASSSIIYGFSSGQAAADLSAWLQAGLGSIDAAPAGAPNDQEPASIVRLKGTDTYQVLDKDGKAIISFKRDAAGKAAPEVVDVDGKVRRILSPQGGSLELDGTVAEAKIIFDEPFKEHPSVTFTPSSPSGNFKTRVSKTEASIAFQSPPVAGTTIGVVAHGKR